MQTKSGALKFINISREQVHFKLKPLRRNESRIVHLLNTYNLSIAYKDIKYFHLLQNDYLNFIDSRILQIYLQFYFGTPIMQNRGTDLMRRILLDPSNGLSHLFICPNIENANMLESVIRNKFPLIHGNFIVPAFTSNLEKLGNEIIDKISDTQFDYIWVGIGTPKQDYIADYLAKTRGGTYIFCIGAALEFMAETKNESPRFIQMIGMEWLHRFSQEPRRLFLRYFVNSWAFIKLIKNQQVELYEI